MKTSVKSVILGDINISLDNITLSVCVRLSN
jgi:hypothetical protein